MKELYKFSSLTLVFMFLAGFVEAQDITISGGQIEDITENTFWSSLT